MSSKWKVLSTKELFKSGLFRLCVDRCELPDGRVMPRYYTFDFPDWVQAVAITSSGEMIMMSQYRHSAKDIFLEVSGGSLDPRLAETPMAAAQRELLEETGYSSSNWKSLGVHYPNPALMSNRLHTFLALDCVKVAQPKLDPYEDLSVCLMSVSDVYRAVRNGRVQHSLILASLFMAEPYLKQTR